MSHQGASCVSAAKVLFREEASAAKAKRSSMLHQVSCVKVDGDEKDGNPGQPPTCPIEWSNLWNRQQREEPQEEVNNEKDLYNHFALPLTFLKFGLALFAFAEAFLAPAAIIASALSCETPSFLATEAAAALNPIPFAITPSFRNQKGDALSAVSGFEPIVSPLRAAFRERRICSGFTCPGFLIAFL